MYFPPLPMSRLHVRCPCLENAEYLALYNLEPTAGIALFIFSSITGALPMQVQDFLIFACILTFLSSCQVSHSTFSSGFVAAICRGVILKVLGPV